jgi:hypothetical protein
MGVAKGQEVWGGARGQAVVKGRHGSGSIRDDVRAQVVSNKFQGCNKCLAGIRDVAKVQAVSHQRSASIRDVVRGQAA